MTEPECDNSQKTNLHSVGSKQAMMKLFSTAVLGDDTSKVLELC